MCVTSLIYTLMGGSVNCVYGVDITIKNINLLLLPNFYVEANVLNAVQ